MLIDTLVREHHWALMFIEGRYGDPVIALSHFSDEATYGLITKFTDGDGSYEEVCNLETRCPNLPIGRGATVIGALQALEAKLQAIGAEKINDREWVTNLSIEICEITNEWK